MRATVYLLAAAWALGCCGCLPEPTIVQPLTVSTRDVRPAVRYDDLATVLGKAVDEDGLLLATRLDRVSDRLESQLALLAVTGPSTTPELLPTPEDRLAYWYNARAAWAIRLASACDCPLEVPTQRYDRRPVQIDGRQMTLRAIDEVLARDDWRTVVAAPCVRYSRARLPDRPLEAATVRERIARRFQAFMGDPERFRIDVQRQEILIPPVVWRYRKALIDRHHRRYDTVGATLATALLPYVRGGPRRRLHDAVGYRCVPDRGRDELAIRRPD